MPGIGVGQARGSQVKIGALAERSGVPAKTIRFWESCGLVPEPDRTASGYRNYAADAVERLTFIRAAQAAGLTLEQIRQVLVMGDSGHPTCEHVARLVDERLAEVEARIAELTRTRAHLHHLAERASRQDPEECRGYCSIIEEAERSGPATGGRGPDRNRPRGIRLAG